MPMKRFWGRVGALVIAGGTGVSLAACAHDDSTLFVFDVLAGTVSGTTCTFTADPTQPFISSGLLDAELTNEYEATFLVANQMVTQADPTIPQTESAFITINHANVRITNPDGSAIRSYSTVTSASVFPASGTTPSFVPATVPIIDQQALTMIAGIGGGSLVRVETFVKFFGKSTGGTSVESNEFQFPVDICAGCLIAFPAAEDDPAATAQPNCNNATAASSGTSSVPTPCRVGQDAPVDCAECKSANAACR
jgi:hypothetical protein